MKLGGNQMQSVTSKQTNKQTVNIRVWTGIVIIGTEPEQNNQIRENRREKRKNEAVGMLVLMHMKIRSKKVYD